jgi:hypothetical protein
MGKKFSPLLSNQWDPLIHEAYIQRIQVALSMGVKRSELETDHSPLCNTVVKKWVELSVILGFRRDIGELGAPRGYYAASIGSPLPTFRDNVSVPSWRIKKSRRPLKSEAIRCPETSVKDYHSMLRNNPEERRSH